MLLLVEDVCPSAEVSDQLGTADTLRAKGGRGGQGSDEGGGVKRAGYGSEEGMRMRSEEGRGVLSDERRVRREGGSEKWEATHDE